jgi:chromosome segregation ATPase
MSTTPLLRRGSTFALMLLMLAPLGCASSGNPGRAAAMQTVDQVDRLAEAVQNSRDQVGQTVQVLEQLPGAGRELPDAYNRFTKQVETMTRSSEAVAERRAAMRKQFAAYQQQWYSETVEMDNDTLRQAAQQRVNEVRRDFDALQPAYRSVRESYVPFLDQLEQVRTYLGLDLTTPSVKAMVPTIEDVRGSAATLRQDLDNLLIDLRTLSDSLKPATSGPAAE